MNLLYSDDALLVIEKPADLPVLPDGWKPDSPYLVKMLEREYGKVWVVHRLDKITSGVMLFARTAEAHRELNRQFDQREVEKTYHALVAGTPAWDEQICQAPLRANVGHKHRSVVDRERGKASETRFNVLERGQAGALVEARPVTGRTHQIRVHLSALGFPLLGDVLYGAAESGLIDRPALHAISLAFAHPLSKQRLAFSAEYPQDFVTALKRLGL
ncbi:MAG: RluA family pseudouridine synthase [Chloroflexota bacterium]